MNLKGLDLDYELRNIGLDVAAILTLATSPEHKAAIVRRLADLTAQAIAMAAEQEKQIGPFCEAAAVDLVHDAFRHYKAKMRPIKKMERAS